MCVCQVSGIHYASAPHTHTHTHSHVGSKTCEALSTTASHSQQQGIAEGLADYAGDPCYVFKSVHEQLKFHLGCAHLAERRKGQ